MSVPPNWDAVAMPVHVNEEHDMVEAETEFAVIPRREMFDVTKALTVVLEVLFPPVASDPASDI